LVPELREYCFPQIFNESCGEGEVMLMEAARYGRMKQGRCLNSDYKIGCWADVLPQVDRMCSGRRSCQINIPDTTLHMLQPCPKDVFAYLEASYNCVKGTSHMQGMEISWSRRPRLLHGYRMHF
jgi:hypothetical protein